MIKTDKKRSIKLTIYAKISLVLSRIYFDQKLSVLKIKISKEHQ